MTDHGTSSKRWPLRVLLAIVFLGLVTRYGVKAVDGNDYGAYHAAGRAVLEGADIYKVASAEKRYYLYPPTLAILVAPLTLLPERAGAVLWVALALAGILMACHLAVGSTRPRGRREACWIGGLALLAVARPIDSELGNGQANYLVLLFVSLAIHQFVRGRSFGSGLALAVAIACKVTPLVLCGYLVMRRQWRALGGVAAGLFLLVLVLPAMVWGPKKAIATNIDWAAHHVVPFTQAEMEAEDRDEPSLVRGYSLRAVVYRLFTHTVASTHHDDPIYVNVADWPPERVDEIYKVLAVLFLGATALSCGFRRSGSGGRYLVEISLWIAVMVLAAPLTRKAHLVVLLVPFVAALSLAFRGRARSVVPWIVLSAACFNLTSPGILTRAGTTYALANGVLLLGMLSLWTGLCIEGFRGATVPVPEGEDS